MKRSVGMFTRLKGNLKALRKDESGFTAVEFALVAMPFVMLILGVIQIALFYFTTFSLENALERAAREIRTGQAQSQSIDAQAFKDKVCANMPGFADCAGHVRVDVRSFGSFSGIQGNTPPGLDGEGNLGSNFNFAPGQGGDVVLVTAFYEWTLTKYIPFLELGNMAGGSRLIQAAVAFRNEPFN